MRSYSQPGGDCGKITQSGCDQQAPFFLDEQGFHSEQRWLGYLPCASCSIRGASQANHYWNKGHLVCHRKGTGQDHPAFKDSRSVGCQPSPATTLGSPIRDLSARAPLPGSVCSLALTTSCVRQKLYYE